MQVEGEPSGLEQRMGLLCLIACPLEMAVDLAAGGAAAGEQAPFGLPVVGSVQERTVALALTSLGSQGGQQSGAKCWSCASGKTSPKHVGKS